MKLFTKEFLFWVDLWLILIGSLTIISLASVLLAEFSFTANVRYSVVFMLTVSILSISYAIAYTFRAQKLRQGQNIGRVLSWLLAHSAPFLIGGWLLVTIFGLWVAIQQKSCRRVDDCRLYHALIVLAVMMLGAIILNFYLARRLGVENNTSLLHLRSSKSLSDEEKTLVDSPWSSSKTLVLQNHIQYPTREQYLQRRNSLSSQKAIYPNNDPTFGQRQVCQRNHRMRRTPSRLMSLEESSTLHDGESHYSTSVRNFGSSYSSWSTSSRSMSVRSRYSCNDMSIPLPTVPEQYRMDLYRPRTRASTIPGSSRMSPPPPAWCPKTLRQTPLSADPAIRALSMGRIGYNSQGSIPSVELDSQPRKPSFSLTPALPRKPARVLEQRKGRTNHKRAKNSNTSDFSASSLSIAPNPWAMEDKV